MIRMTQNIRMSMRDIESPYGCVGFPGLIG